MQAFQALLATVLLCCFTSATQSSKGIDFADPRVVASAFKSVVDEIRDLKKSPTAGSASTAASEPTGHMRGSVTDEMRFAASQSKSAQSTASGGFPSLGSMASMAAGAIGAALPGDPVDFPPRGVGVKPMGCGKFVPWGKHIPRKPNTNYYVATGWQECQLCVRMIINAKNAGRSFYSLCNGMETEYLDMCHAQQKVLQGCPEFANDWCYQDYGGTQVLRSPCPDALVCHYCLGLNPLHCMYP